MNVLNPQFAVRVHPGELHFNAAHFITFGNQCENLHGHNFHVRVEALGNNNQDAFVIDFVDLNRRVAQICAELHDKVLLPGLSEEVELLHQEDQIDIHSHGRHFSLPAENCLILPVTNTTAEMLAWYILEQLLPVLEQQNHLHNVETLEVAVEEADQQWGVCRRHLGNRKRLA